MKWKIGILGGVWILFVLGNLLMPDRVFSEAENRYLERKPEIKTNAILDGSYMEDFELWMSDQLILRDELVALHATTDLVTGQGDSGGVYLGKDGYLLEMFTEVDEERLEENIGAVTVFLEGMKEQGVAGHFLAVPTGSYILEEKLPAFAPELDQKQLFAKMREEIPGLIDVSDALKAVAEGSGDSAEEQLYYRTDHHWTSRGAFYAYQLFCRETGKAVPKPEEYEETVLSTDFYGTGYAKAGLYHLEPDTMTAMCRAEAGPVTVDYGDGKPENTLYDRGFLEKRDKYRVYLKGNYPLTKITSSAENGEKLLLIKDSYANTFVQFLTENYEEIHMVDPRYYKGDLESYVREQGITEVLFLYQIKNFAQDTSYLTWANK